MENHGHSRPLKFLDNWIAPRDKYRSPYVQYNVALYRIRVNVRQY